MPPKVTLILVLAAVCASGGWYFRGLKADADQLEATNRLIKQFNEQMTEDREILENTIETKTEIKTVYEVIEREVEVVKSECDDLGPAWLRLYNTAIREAEKATAD